MHTTTIAHNDKGRTEAETRFAGKQRRLVVTRESAEQDWTITHVKSGLSVRSLIPQIMPRTIGNLTALAKAIVDELGDHPAWAVMDATPFGEVPRQRNMSGRDVDHMRDFASKARAIGTRVYSDRYVKRAYL